MSKAEEWKYGSLHERILSQATEPHLCEPLIDLGYDWKKDVNTPMKMYELEKIRNSVNRQSPLEEGLLEIVEDPKRNMMYEKSSLSLFCCPFLSFLSLVIFRDNLPR